MLRTCVIDLKGSWDNYLSLIEFIYNNSYHVSIETPPFEALYGKRCRSPLYWDEVGKTYLVGPKLLQNTIDIVKVIKERLKTVQSRQKSYADM